MDTGGVPRVCTPEGWRTRFSIDFLVQVSTLTIPSGFPLSQRLDPNGFAALRESRPLVVSTGWPLRKNTGGNLWKIRL